MTLPALAAALVEELRFTRRQNGPREFNSRRALYRRVQAWVEHYCCVSVDGVAAPKALCADGSHPAAEAIAMGGPRATARLLAVASPFSVAGRRS